MPRKILVEIDHRCELGAKFWRGIRGQRIAIEVPTPCAVVEDCGAVITPDDRAALWYFTRNSNNTTEVAVLCWKCDRNLVKQAEEEIR